MNRDQIADSATGTRLEALFNRHPRATDAGIVVCLLLLLVLGGLLDAN